MGEGMNAAANRAKTGSLNRKTMGFMTSGGVQIGMSLRTPLRL